ncbi:MULTISPECIES: DUF3616 domain-containing protein [Microcoleaceae]|uniref:DUF3616 domain-containing protein n=1 Tax=Microcoleaceae TaxID=1892252 RepID=UPI00188267FE|nr:DUF3616 domain-containing protein [Tychonema sp. LEGE 06208]MBE9163067.1 DUF3616 domain-containing protein [Tychonema sp. LEGE 06208]
MSESFWLGRLLLQFNSEASEIITDLSAVALTPDGHLWLGSDETTSLECLSPVAPHVFGEHQKFAVADFIDLSGDDEIDIEGIDFSSNCLWLVGSHSTKRKKPKGKDCEDDIERLATIETDVNRYLLAKVPVKDGILYKSISHPENPQIQLTAGCLQRTETGNLLTDALQDDCHLGLYFSVPIPSKENGFDIEGLAVRGDRILLGLRGPVLRGWAIILEIEVEEAEPGVLRLKEIGEAGKLYKKHFVDLNGLGVRELCFNGEDLIVLGGPTMTLSGATRVFRLRNILGRSSSRASLTGDSITGQGGGDLEVLFDLPFQVGTDNAEGLSLFPYLGEENSLLVVYDSPAASRMVGENAIFADIFRLGS